MKKNYVKAESSASDVLMSVVCASAEVTAPNIDGDGGNPRFVSRSLIK